jgi:hypothetical protein
VASSSKPTTGSANVVERFGGHSIDAGSVSVRRGNDRLPACVLTSRLRQSKPGVAASGLTLFPYLVIRCFLWPERDSLMLMEICEKPELMRFFSLPERFSGRVKIGRKLDAACAVDRQGVVYFQVGFQRECGPSP